MPYFSSGWRFVALKNGIVGIDRKLLVNKATPDGISEIQIREKSEELRICPSEQTGRGLAFGDCVELTTTAIPNAKPSKVTSWQIRRKLENHSATGKLENHSATDLH